MSGKVRSGRGGSIGQCERCGAQAGRNGMLGHLRSCAPAQGVPFVHLRLHGAASPVHWVDVAVDPAATLRDLDQFLRAYWLECCGHLSCFRVAGVEYPSSIDRTFPAFGAPQRGMTVPAGKVFSRSGQRAAYEYDFGSTTALVLTVAGTRLVADGNATVQVLARNAPPIWPCAVCGEPAVHVCTDCAHVSDPFVCDLHAGTHDCGDEYFLPVVNSPRMGTCGYTGPLR